MKNTKTNTQDRRRFLKNTLYIAPVLISLGSLDAEASNHKSNTKYCTQSKLHMTESKKSVNNVGKKTYGGHERDMHKGSRSSYKSKSSYGSNSS